ncbi:MAG TPA: YjjG family noncanonical pyrimidine nucleotidase [Chlamydiales bacterium]|nr:YjjG family noncanonical pyrimidine nucleotidase [Chlamydiales bacterium]
MHSKDIRYKAVLFDLDDTLIDFKKSESISLRKCYAKYFHHLSFWDAFYAHYIDVNRNLWNLVEEGKILTSAIANLRFKHIADHYQIPFLPEIVQFYEHQLILHAEWIEGAEELLETLQSFSIPIAFVTNGFTHLQRNKQKKLGFSRFSQIMVVSEECGVAKPHPKIFQTALDLIPSEPSQTLMIGDSLTSDGQGARNLQIPFCWYNPQKLPNPFDWKPDIVIHDLKDAMQHLGIAVQ